MARRRATAAAASSRLAPGFPRRRARRTPSPREGERARTASRDAALQGARRPLLPRAGGRLGPVGGIDVARVSARNRPDRYPFASPWMGRREHGDLRHPIDLGADSVRKVCFAIVSKRKADRVRNLLSPDVRVAIRHWHRRRHVVATCLVRESKFTHGRELHHEPKLDCLGRLAGSHAGVGTLRGSGDVAAGQGLGGERSAW